MLDERSLIVSSIYIAKRRKIFQPQYANEIILKSPSQMSGTSGQLKYKNDLLHPIIYIRRSINPFVGLSIHLSDIEQNHSHHPHHQICHHNHLQHHHHHFHHFHHHHHHQQQHDLIISIFYSCLQWFWLSPHYSRTSIETTQTVSINKKIKV